MSTTSTQLVRFFTVGENEFHSLEAISRMESGLFVSLLKFT